MILIAVILVMCICNVSATDLDDTQNLTDTSDNFVLTSDPADEIVADGEGSFSDLQSEINNGGPAISLIRDYKFTTGDDVNGIKISKNYFTINGNGHSIDGSSCARIFNISGDGVILNNLIIKNAFINNTINYINSTNNNINISIGNGAGIMWTGNNGVLNNTIITNNIIVNEITFMNVGDVNANYAIGNGAGLYASGENITIENTTISNNNIQSNSIYSYNHYNNVYTFFCNGAGAYITSNNVVIRKSIFTKNSLNHTSNDTQNSNVNSAGSWANGGALYHVGDTLKILSTTFSENYASNNAGAAFIRGITNLITDSNFTKNTAKNIGAIFAHGFSNSNSVITIENSNFIGNSALTSSVGAIDINYVDSIVTNSRFINNSAFTSGGALYFGGSYGILSNSYFENNTADTGGAVYWSGSYGTITNSIFVNNDARISKDIYSSTTTLTITKNNFTGKYAEIANKVINGWEYLTIKNDHKTTDNILVSVIVDNTQYKMLTLQRNSNSEILLSGLDNQAHNVNITFRNSDDNIYKNIASEFTVVSNTSSGVTLYVRSSGNGNGLNPSTACSWSYALNNIPNGGKIILLDGIYTNIVNQVIDKSITITGQGNVVIDAQNKGSIFQVISDNVTINNIIFMNGQSSTDVYSYSSCGGAIGWVGDNGILTSCSFINNTNIGSGTGAIQFIGNNSFVSDCIFENNTGSNYGVVIAYYGSGTRFINITNTRFINNKITGSNGGALSLLYNFELTNSSFINNSAYSAGGALDISASGIIENCNFTDNNAYHGVGGAIYTRGGSSIIRWCNFTENTAWSNGGAIYYGAGSLVVNNTIFINNNASISNDIYRGTNSLSMDNNIFTGSYVYANNLIVAEDSFIVKVTSDMDDLFAKVIIDGSVVDTFSIDAESTENTNLDLDLSSLSYGTHNLNLTFSTYTNNTYINNVFAFNYAAGESLLYVSPNGGGTGLSEGSPTLWSDALTHIGVGGTIRLLSGTYNSIIVDDVISRDNVSIVGWQNGVVFDNLGANNRFLTINSNNVHISNIIFMNGVQTNYGGALYWKGDNGILNNCTFINNYLTNVAGGAVCVIGNNTLVTKCIFDSNHVSGHGGALRAETIGNIITIRDCLFKNNYATSTCAGALRLSMNFNVVNCTFTNNTSYGEDGAIMILGTVYGNITRCIIRDTINSASSNQRSGALTVYSGSCVVRECEFTNNTEKNGYGGAICIRSGSLTVISSNFTNNTALMSSDDIYRNGGSVSLINNIFNTNARITDEGILRINSVYDNVAVTAVVSIDDSVTTYNIPASSNTNFNINLNELGNGYHNITVEFTTSGFNTYKSFSTTYYIAKPDIIFVSPHGMGNGSSKNNPTNWNDALNNINVGGTIVLLDGNYYNILNSQISKSIIVKGLGNTIINANKQNRVFNVTGDNVTIANITFINGQSGNGGAIYWKGDNGILTNCSFTSNTATGNGGAIYWKGNNGTISNSEFINNTASISNDIHRNSTDLNINNNNFKGTYLTAESTVNVDENFTIVIKITSDDNVNVTAHIWVNNTLIESVIVPSRSTGDVSVNLTGFNTKGSRVLNVTFENGSNTYNNIATIKINVVNELLIYVNPIGGGTGLSEDSPTTLTDALNRISNGGTIRLLAGTYVGIMNEYVYRSINLIGQDNVIFDNNGYGSRFLTISADNVVIRNIIFMNGLQSGDGGALYWIGDNGVLDNCTFIKNRVTGTNGGAVYITGNNTNVTKCVFDSNQVNDHGGSIRAIGTNMFINIRDCEFKNNIMTGACGAAISSTMSSNIVNCTFNNNSGNSNGGTIFLTNSLSSHNVINSTFKDNIAWSSGAGTISVWNTNVFVKNCEFTNNTAAYYGAAIYVNGGSLTVSDSNFTNNTASTSDDIYRNNGNVILSNNIFNTNARITDDGILRINSVYDNVVISSVVSIDDSVTTYNITASSNTNFNIDLNNLGNGYHNITVEFTTSGFNTYKSFSTTYYIAKPDIIFVSPHGMGNGLSKNNPTNWNDALNNINVAGTIVLLDGNYYNILNSQISKSIIVKGLGNTIINANKQNRVFNVTGDNVTIANITFINGQSGNGGAIYWKGDNGILTNCSFTSNTATGNGGSIYWKGNNGTISNSEFTNNAASTSNDIYRGNDDLSIVNNIFKGTYAIVDSSVNVGDNVSVVIKITSDDNVDVTAYIRINNTLIYSVIVPSRSTSDVSVNLSGFSTKGSRVLNVTFENGVNSYNNVAVVFNVVDDSVIYADPYGGGDGLSEDSPTSWSDALSRMKDGGTIRLLAGTYVGFSNGQVSKSISIVGWQDNVVFSKGSRFLTITADNVVIKNITFRDAIHSTDGSAIYWSGNNGILDNCNFINNYITVNAGGAVYVDGNNVTVTNCVFDSNHGVGHGCGLRAGGSSKFITIRDCVFKNNLGTGTCGAALRLGMNYNVVNCNFTNNTSNSEDGIVMIIGSIYGNITGCEFSDNLNTGNQGSRSGTITVHSGSCVVRDCEFINNSAQNGGAICMRVGSLTVIDSNFTNNTARNNGGAIYRNTGTINYINGSRFINNTATSSGAAIYVTNALNIYNSVFEDNIVKNAKITYSSTSNNISVTFSGVDTYLNGIFSNGNDVALYNVSYWNDGERNTQTDTIYKNANQNASIKIDLYDINDNTTVVYSVGGFTNDGGVVSFDGWDLGNYHAVIYHQTGPTKKILTEFDYISVVYVSVDGNGTGYTISDATNLTNALSICANGGKIILNGGTYNITEEISITKPVTIIGSGDDTILDGLNTNRILKVTADNVSICNVTFINGNADEGGALYWIGKNGVLNNTKFYNNTAGTGSAIYATEELKIYNSVFLDNLADVDFTYTKSDDGFSVHLVSHDNYANAIYASKAPSVIHDVTFWGTLGVVTSSSVVDAMAYHNVTVVLAHKINQTEIDSYTTFTDENGNITKENLVKNIYYEATIKHFTGLNKYRSILFDIPVNITVSKLELYVLGSIEKGDNLTVVALVNGNATGKVNFTINNQSIAIVDVVDGRAYLSVNPNLTVGDYELVAVYIPEDGSGYYGQRNSTDFSVKVKSNPYVVVLVPDTYTNDTVLVIQANTNFELNQEITDARPSLQLVVLLQHFSCNTLSVGLF